MKNFVLGFSAACLMFVVATVKSAEAQLDSKLRLTYSKDRAALTSVVYQIVPTLRSDGGVSSEIRVTACGSVPDENGGEPLRRCPEETLEGAARIAAAQQCIDRGLPVFLKGTRLQP